jgi:membrane protease YdiL (CAAX protease family)
MNNSSIIQKYKHTALFYVLATVIPWAFWFAAAYISHHLTPENKAANIATALGLAGLFSPVIVAFWLISRSRDLRKDAFGRFLNFQADKFWYYVLACLLMLASILLAQAVSLLFGHSVSQFVITGHFTFTSGVLPVWFLLSLAPVIEELAWHSYGTDSLRSRMNLFKASLLFGIYWAIWHFPQAGIKDYYHANVVAEGLLYGLNFIVSIIPFVILMNWLYYKTNRNILVPIVFHFTSGYFNEIFATHPDSKCIQTVILLIISVIVVIKERDLFFRKQLM